MYWYIELDGQVLPTPYQTYDACMAAIRKMQEEFVAPCLNPVLL